MGRLRTSTGAAVCQAEPYHRGRYRRLVGRLLSLVVAGDVDGQEPIGDDAAMPWEIDDQAKPHDTETRARFLWPMAAREAR